MFGFLNIYKPKGVTSGYVVNILKRITKIKQIGHSGTLDPIAEGVLPIAIGKATKLIDYLGNEKEYIATMEFGKTSPSYDTESEITKLENVKTINKNDLAKCLEIFIGETEQIPPIYSAVHLNGKRLYELARNNIKENDIDIPKRKIVINKIELINFDEAKQTAELKIACQKGTYIRALIRDIGIQLDNGAIMTKLIRTNSSGFKIENSLDFNTLTFESIKTNVIKVCDILKMECIEISDEEYNKIKFGNAITKECNYKDGTKILVLKNEEVVALGEKQENMICMKKVFI